MYPVLPRVFAGVTALFAGAYLLFLQPIDLIRTGHPLAAQVMAVTAVPLVLFLAWMAGHPASLQKVLAPVSRLQLRDGGHAAAALILALALYYVLGLGALVGGAYAYEEGAPTAESDLGMDESLLVASLVLNVIVLVLPVVLYVSFVYGFGPRRTLRAVGLHGDGALLALAIGVACAIGALVLIALVSLGLQQGGVELPENDRALAIARSVTLPGALAIATLSALSEEVFFRGFLQPRIGLLGQAILFSLAHLSYVNATETIVTFVLALAFGLIYKRTGNLWAPIAAHFAFNLMMLLAGMYAT